MNKDRASLNEISEQIIGCAYAVANVLGTGFLEKVYEKSLAYELEKNGLKVSRQHPIEVHYREVVVGEYFADILVEDEIILELKVVSDFENSHIAQCLNYLKATKKKLALLINFNSPRVQVKRIVNSF